MPVPLDDQNIIKLLGIESLPDERKVALVNKISDLAQKRLLLRLLESLSAPDQEKLKSLLDGGDQTALSQFLQDKAPDMGAWAADEVLKLKNELVSFAK